MKSKYRVLALAGIPFFGTYANDQTNSTFQQDRICEEIAGLNLTAQFNAGTLQQKANLKEIDPHALIHKAVLENSPEVIRFLLNQGVSVDYPDQNGMTPLTIAILNRCNYAVDVFLDHGANVNPKIRWNGMTLLELTSFMNDLETTKKLIQRGSNVNGGSGDGTSLLSYAIQRGGYNPDFIEIAKNMINQGAEIKGADVFCAICTASENDDSSLLEFMINKGLDVNMQDTIDGYSPFILRATEKWDEKVIRLLLKSGADLNKEGGSMEFGRKTTPLLSAIYSCQLERVRLLVELGADVNQTISHDGVVISPINAALEKRRPEIVQYLLQHGARA